MAGVLVTDATPIMVLDKSPRRGVTLQNNSSVAIFISWTGDSKVVAAADLPNSGYQLAVGATLDISDEYLGANTANNSIWAIAASGSTNDLRYFIR